MQKLITKEASKVIAGGIYCCFIGTKFDGHEFINEALKNGASRIYGTKPIEGVINYVQVDDINQTYLDLCKEIYQFDLIKENIKIIGITGTDGKTSTALILSQILNKMGLGASYLGTSGFMIGNNEVENIGLTTPFAEDLYRYLQTSYQNGVKYFVMEVSSHALEQNRLGDLLFDGVVLTNLTPEHLDFHKDMESYKQAKLKILDKVKEGGVKVVNADDIYFNDVSKQDDVISFSCDLNKANYQVGCVSANLDGNKFYINHRLINSNLIGEFNIYNLTAVLVLLEQLGIDYTPYLNEIKQITVDGRMEVTRLANNNKVIIDFAHTPDSIKKVLKLVRNNTKGRVFVVNGCAGERDTTKRATIGSIMDKYCDGIILTEDDPRSESVSDINNQIKQGIGDPNKVREIEDRVSAIRFGLSNLANDDVLVLLGKGGQKVQYKKEGTVPYIEQEVVNSLIGR